MKYANNLNRYYPPLNFPQNIQKEYLKANSFMNNTSVKANRKHVNFFEYEKRPSTFRESNEEILKKRLESMLSNSYEKERFLSNPNYQSLSKQNLIPKDYMNYKELTLDSKKNNQNSLFNERAKYISTSKDNKKQKNKILNKIYEMKEEIIKGRNVEMINQYHSQEKLNINNVNNFGQKPQIFEKNSPRKSQVIEAKNLILSKFDNSLNVNETKNYLNEKGNNSKHLIFTSLESLLPKEVLIKILKRIQIATKSDLLLLSKAYRTNLCLLASAINQKID